MAALPPTTLAEAAAAEEARLFAGRAHELQRLEAAMERLDAGPVAVYVSGPAGCGKSALLRAFARRAEAGGIPAALTRSDRIPQEPPWSVEATLAATAAWQSRRRWGNRRVLPRLLLIDDYDALGAGEPRVREEFLGGVGEGVAVVLAGRTPACRLWADAPQWRGTVEEIALGPLHPAEADEVLRRAGLADPALRAAVVAVAAGQPRLLLRGAAAAADSDWFAGAAVREPQLAELFLLERLLHPGSRRRAWRATGPDELIAAASLLPHLDREALIAALGRTAVQEGWEALLGLAGGAAGGRPALPEPLRERLAAATRAQRPWAEARWRRSFREHLCARAARPAPADDAAENWHALLAAARGSAWHSLLHPEDERAEGWVVRRHPEGSGWSVLRPDGALLGEARCEAGMPAPGTLRLHLRIAPGPAAAGAAGVLLREAGAGFAACRRVLIPAPAPWGEDASPLPALGFRRDPEVPGGWMLDLASEPGGFPGWLRRICQPPQAAPPGDPAAAAREALAAIGDPQRLGRTAAMACYQTLHGGRGTPQDLRAWLLDAVVSCGLSPTQQAILLHYYVDGTGPHEALAERLDVPRATYYRLHRLALERLGQAIFEP